MAKVVLHSTEEYRKKSKVVLAHAGVTQFDEEGKTEVDVTDEQLADVLDSYPDLFIPYGKELGTDSESSKEDATASQTQEQDLAKSEETLIEPQVTEQDLGKSEEDKNDIGGTEEDDTDLNSPLHGMKVAELKELAKSSGFPEAEWSELKKPELKAYLLGKLNQQ